MRPGYLDPNKFPNRMGGNAMSHQIMVCQFNVMHGQCRCPAPNKTVVTVPCDQVSEHSHIFKMVEKQKNTDTLAMVDEDSKPQSWENVITAAKDIKGVNDDQDRS